MPYDSSWVEPEVALDYKDVTVYHTYRHNDICDGTNHYIYVTCTDDYDEKWEFDIRDSIQWPQLGVNGQPSIDLTLKAIIDAGPWQENEPVITKFWGPVQVKEDDRVPTTQQHEG